MASTIQEAMQEMMKRNAPNMERPPNLREGDSRINCATCRHFEGGICRLYDYHVQPEQVCDRWSPLEK